MKTKNCDTNRPYIPSKSAGPISRIYIEILGCRFVYSTSRENVSLPGPILSTPPLPPQQQPLGRSPRRSRWFGLGCPRIVGNRRCGVDPRHSPCWGCNAQGRGVGGWGLGGGRREESTRRTTMSGNNTNLPLNEPDNEALLVVVRAHLGNVDE